MKRCSRCRETKPLDDFYRLRKARDGRQGYCKQCSKQDQRDRAERNPRMYRSRQLAPVGQKHCLDCDRIKPLSQFPRNARKSDGYHTYCKACHLARGHESDQRLHGSTKDRYLKRRYGITASDVDAMFTAQRGLCAICDEAVAAHVDHDHKTGRVRALLCFNCNQGLGNFRDRADVMEAAIQFVRQHDPATQELADAVLERLGRLKAQGAFDRAV